MKAVMVYIKVVLKPPSASHNSEAIQEAQEKYVCRKQDKIKKGSKVTMLTVNPTETRKLNDKKAVPKLSLSLGFPPVHAPCLHQSSKIRPKGLFHYG